MLHTAKAPESMSRALEQGEGPLMFRDPEVTWTRKMTEKKELTGDKWSFSWTRKGKATTRNTKANVTEGKFGK